MIQKTFITISLLLALSFSAGAQSFVYTANTPFGIEIANFVDSNRVALKYIFEDADNDGDLDLFLFGLDEEDTTSYHPSFVARLRYFVEYQENIGTKFEPQFAPRDKRYESLEFPKGKSFVIPDIGDINGDKRSDFFICSEVDEYSLQFPLIYLQEDGLTFTKTLCTDWNLDPIIQYSFYIPELTDLDMDGDLDILMSGYACYDVIGEEKVNTFLYAKNIGSSTDPEFLGWFENPYGLEPALYNQMLSAGDIDLDGDMDLISMSQTEDVATIEFFENVPGVNGKPAFREAVLAPYGLPQPKHENDSYLFPALTDIDGDGDIDAFFFHQEEIDEETTNVGLDFYENKMCDGGINATVEASGSSLTAFQDFNYIYQWFDCDSGEDIQSSTNYTFEAPYSGAFSVRITNELGCKAESDCYDVIASNTVSETVSSKVEVFPNPSNGMVNINNRSAQEIQEIMIYDVQGKKIKTLSSGFNRIDLTGKKQGLYLVKIVMDNEFEIMKEIVLLK